MSYMFATAFLFGYVSIKMCTCIETVTLMSYGTQKLPAMKLNNGNGTKGVILTTAKVVQEVDMPKPTAGFRRSNMLVQHDPKTQDLFETRRSNRKEMWEWDYWCQIQPKTGKCHNTERSRTSFYYDTQLDECMPFDYSGCLGNENNFRSKTDCEQHCKGSALMPFKAIGRQSSCLLQPHSGVCLSLLSRYYYDVNSGSCKKFLYGGCGGNDNRFYTKRYCLDACRHTDKALRSNIAAEIRTSPSVARVTMFGSMNYDPSDELSA